MRKLLIGLGLVAGCATDSMVQPEEQFEVPLAVSTNPMRAVGEAHNRQLHANMLRVRGMERTEMVEYLQALEAKRAPMAVSEEWSNEATELLNQLLVPVEDLATAMQTARMIQQNALYSTLSADERDIVLAAASVLENSATYWDAMAYAPTLPEGLALSPFCRGDTGPMGVMFCKLGGSFGSIVGADVAGAVAGAAACRWTGGGMFNCAVGGAVIGSTTEAVTRLLK